MTDWRWIGQELRAERIARGKSQLWVARRAEITQAQLSLIELGRSLPPLSTLERIADALNLRIRLHIERDGEASDATLDLSHLPQSSRAAIRLLARQIEGAAEEPDE